ncbi:LysE family transporter [Polaribacter uvawellassae]|uniref:LysE family transporter n=1 Tax=Polaribacter uvawellassae TaxID=3133495 RepID=UPI00321AB22A
MSILLHFLFGFAFSFSGSITPSMLNMTALKISLEKNEKEAQFYSLGVSLIVFIQAFIAILLTKYIYENPTILETLEKAGIVIFILLSIYFFKQSKSNKKEVKASKDRKGNSFLSGVVLSMLNMFAIPFFCGVTATLEVFNLMSFDRFPVAFFIIGSTIGTFCILFLYGKYAKNIQKKTGKLTKDISLILSIITGLVAVFMLIKTVVLN